MDHRAWQIAGRPVAICKPEALGHLEAANQWLALLQSQLLVSIARWLTPQLPVKPIWPPNATPEPPELPPQRMRRFADGLSQCLDLARKELELSLFCAKYKISGYGDWNLPDDLVLRPLPLPDSFETEWAATNARLTRLTQGVRRKQRRMIVALRIYEHAESGQPFRCRDVSVCRELSQSDPPLLNKYRDAAGVWWTKA